MTDQQDQRQSPGRRATDGIAHGWHLDKKVPLSLIFAMLMQGAMVIWAIADIKKDVEILKANQVVLSQQDVRQVSDLRDSMLSVREQFTAINAKLDRLIERNMK